MNPVIFITAKLAGIMRIQGGRKGVATMQDHLDVLIAGAGPVGLSLAVELGMRGIKCLVVEQNDRVGYSPRAKMTNVRTREHLRRWGIADELRRVSPIRSDYPAHVVFATRMNGPLLARFEHAWNCLPDRNDLYSEGAQWVPQFVLEEVLRSRAVSLPAVQVQFNTALKGFAESGDGIVADLDDVVTGTARRVHSRYLVGADGARSTVRKLMGVRLLGDGGSASNLNFVFRSRGLADAHRHGPAVMYWMVNEDFPGLLGPMSDDGLWYFIATKVAGSADPATIDAANLIRRSTGLDVDIEIVGADPLGRPPPRRRAVSGRPRLPGRRFLSPASALRRVRHEHGGGRCRRPRLETCRDAGRLGR